MEDIETTAEIIQLQAQVALTVTDAEGLVEIDDANIHDAGEVLARCAGILKNSEALRIRATKPILEAKKNVDAMFKEAVAPIQSLSDRLRQGITAFNTERERARQQQEALARAAIEKRAREQQADRARLAQAAGLPEDAIPVLDLSRAVIVPPLDTEVITASGRITARPVVKVYISDPDKVPRPWCIPDHKAIESFVKAAVKDGSIEEARRTISEVFWGGVGFEIEMTTVVNTD